MRVVAALAENERAERRGGRETGEGKEEGGRRPRRLDRMGKWHHGGRLLKTRAGVEQGLCRMRQEGWRKKEETAKEKEERVP
jgi:hypothetical protein